MYPPLQLFSKARWCSVRPAYIISPDGKAVQCALARLYNVTNSTMQLKLIMVNYYHQFCLARVQLRILSQYLYNIV